jgi:hypothetical protein
MYRIYLSNSWPYEYQLNIMSSLISRRTVFLSPERFLHVVLVVVNFIKHGNFKPQIERYFKQYIW